LPVSLSNEVHAEDLEDLVRRAFSVVFLVAGAVTMLTLVLAMPVHTPSATAVGIVDVWLTTGDQNKLQHSYVPLYPGNGSNLLKIQVNENITYQQIEGFGAALTDSAAWVISTALDVTQTHTLLNKLFSPSEGIGISYLRLPMGASDFVTSTHYTYDDLPPGEIDPDLDFFSIAHDQAYIIPILRQARSINPQLRFMGSPWSAPAWMKSPETLYGGSLQPGYYQAYANYFVRFIQAYEAEGVSIQSITIQNEPHCTSVTYPTMWMEPEQQAEFIKHYLGPAFGDAGITNTKILIWDGNWDEPGFPVEILEDSDARAYVAGSAWHCYAGTPDAQTAVHEIHPDKDIFFTECTGGEWDTDFASVLVWNFQNLFIGAVRNWAKVALLWNLALDENHGPHNGGCDDCRGIVTVHRGSGEVEYNVEYYIIGHLSKFVDPGAHRVESDHLPEKLESFASQNPDGSIVLVVLNPGTSSGSLSFDVLWSGQHFSYSLDTQSVATFKWRIQRIYLPLMLRAYRIPISFQDFEPDEERWKRGVGCKMRRDDRLRERFPPGGTDR
jgi:glucosylceramidase